jgi:plasmid stabilization system protein ParE
MKRTVVFRSIARREFDEAALWYDAQRFGLGIDFIDAVEEMVSEIAGDPERHPIVRQDCRRAVLRRFPYTIHYLIEENRIVIVAVFHAKRNPTQLEDR